MNDELPVEKRPNPPFKRSTLGRRTNNADAVGSVQVRVVLADGKGGAIKGNVQRSFTIRGQRVSEVAAALEAFCFGESDAPPEVPVSGHEGTHPQ